MHAYPMIKHIITTVFIATAGLVSLKAAPAPVNLGGFNKNQAFKLKVIERTVGATVGTTVVTNPAVPSAVPNLTLNQETSFTIGSKGELKGPRFSIPIIASNNTVNNYATVPKRGNLSINQAIVYKAGSNPSTPTEVFLTFFNVKLKGNVPTTTTVVYHLK
jgi:hypothetical protein